MPDPVYVINFENIIYHIHVNAVYRKMFLTKVYLNILFKNRKRITITRCMLEKNDKK